MPHKTYAGKTGIVWNVTKRAIGVEFNKRVRRGSSCSLWWLGFAFLIIQACLSQESITIPNVRPSLCVCMSMSLLSLL